MSRVRQHVSVGGRSRHSLATTLELPPLDTPPRTESSTGHRGAQLAAGSTQASGIVVGDDADTDSAAARRLLDEAVVTTKAFIVSTYSAIRRQ